MMAVASNKLVWEHIPIAERRGLRYTGPGLHILVQDSHVRSLTATLGTPLQHAPALTVMPTTSSALAAMVPTNSAVLTLRWSKTGSNLVKSGPSWSNLVQTGQIWP